MFQQRQTKNIFEAALTTVALIYHLTVYKLRKGERNAITGLAMIIFQAVLLVTVFYVFFYLMGLRTSPIRGNLIVYIMTGIFMFMVNNASIQTITGAESSISALMKHGPMNPAITICASALSVLYQQAIAAGVLLFATNHFIAPIELESLLGCIAMFLLAWFSGCCIGLLFRAAMPWWPRGISQITQFYRRANMVASGKMFVANTLPPALLSMFDWNPLFHIVDQTRGFAFINYAPRNTSLEYPIYASLAIAMIGLMIDFVTRQRLSVSWGAGR